MVSGSVVEPHQLVTSNLDANVAINQPGFYPYPENGAWDVAFDRTFSPKLIASFNGTKLDFDGWKQQYRNFNATLAAVFKPGTYTFEFKDVVAVEPDVSLGSNLGFITSTGQVQAYRLNAPADAPPITYRNGGFGVVEVNKETGDRKIIEFRESATIANSAKLEPAVEWTCTLPATL
jgi:hypothetical protein